MNSDLKFTLLFSAIRNISKKLSDNGLKEMNLTSSQMNIYFTYALMIIVKSIRKI